MWELLFRNRGFPNGDQQTWPAVIVYGGSLCPLRCQGMTGPTSVEDAAASICGGRRKGFLDTAANFLYFSTAILFLPLEESV